VRIVVEGSDQIRVVQVGIGTVGSEVLRQLAAGRDRWRRDLDVDVSVAAIVTRDGALIGADGEISSALFAAAIAGRGRGESLAALAGSDGATFADPGDAVSESANRGPTVLIDAATGEETADLDARALASGAGVVLSNKAPLTLPRSSAVSRALWGEAGPRGRLRQEATCGAGLPVFSTLRALLDTGDEVKEILGAVSGTLGAIFSDIETGRPFSIAVHAAMEHGYTEPDPRDDLSGLDVARKALILARMIGVEADLDDVAVEGLVPEPLSAVSGVSVATFLEQAGALDEALARRSAEAQEAGKVLRYVAAVAPDRPLAVGVRAVASGSVLGALRGPENAVSIRTGRYDAFPLGISGPGAGPAVTAAGMVADLLALATGPLRRGGLGSVR
jgi:homoserine dehydrogenase